MKQNFCPYCGNKLEKNFKFCPSCGKELNSADYSKEEKQEEKAKQKELPSTRITSYTLLALSFIFAITVVFLVLSSNQHTDEGAAGQQAQAEQPTEQMNQMMQSVLETKAALEKDPLNYELNVKMANNAFDIGRFEQAVKYYRTAVSVNDSDPDILIDLGVAYFNLNASDSALYFMNSALEINPLHPQGLFNTGIVYFNMGDTLQAIDIWEKLVETNGDMPQAKNAQKFIEQLKNKLNKS